MIKLSFDAIIDIKISYIYELGATNMKNYLTLREDEIDKFIYRIISIDYLLEFLKISELTLVKPKLWDDPFENVILKSLLANSPSESSFYREDVFGQCWTILNLGFSKRIFKSRLYQVPKIQWS